jgi:hypothetical protein
LEHHLGVLADLRVVLTLKKKLGCDDPIRAYATPRASVGMSERGITSAEQ